MNISSILDIEGGIRSFFSSLSVSLSFNLMFIIGLSVELALILFFVIKSYYSYEIRTTKALDRLNKWLFVNKKLTTENIKEFTNLVKSCPKRLSYNWQQFILYREKAPSEYLTMDNIIEKPLRASSFDSNIKNMGIFSYIFSAIMLVMGLAHSGAGETVLNTYLVIVALSIPFLMLLMYGIARICLMAKKHSNLDTLYQNLHLFQRFIDNACIDLPPFIDFTLLFSVEEIEKGIPALREFLESRARKEKEEFDKARSEMVEYEKYDFEKAGIDGSNILDRAMKETETYLSNKNKTLAKISQIEAALESLKKNFDNIQKEFQRKMQVSKENIDRLRQSQEETTSRIESNFLRKQQMAEITKQEKEESDFEQQKRRYLVEKNDYEEEIKNLNSELDNGKNDVEKAMLAEYQTFYTRVCQKAAENVNSDIQSELSNLKELSENTEEDLAQAQTVIKRLEDENLTLRKKLNSDENNEIESYKIEAENNKDKKSKKSKPVVEEYSFDEAEDEEQQIEENPTKKEEVEQGAKHAVNIPQPETYSFDEEVQYDNSSESQEDKVIDRKEDTNELSENKNESRQAIYENLFNENYDYEEVDNNDEETFNYDEVDVVDEDKEVPLNQNIDVMSEKKKRGRPVGSVKAKPQIETVKRGRGRPKKEKIEAKEKRGRGRPVGSTKKVNSPSVKNRNSKTKQKVTSNEEKRGRGRPRKNTSIETINSKIKAEEQKALKAKNKADNQINKAIKGIDNSIKKEQERQRLIAEIEELRRQTQEVSDSSPEELEKISHKVEALLKRIEELED